MKLKLSRALMLVLLATFAVALLKSISETRADVTYCTFCCNPGCDGANGNATPTPTPTATPTPSPSPTPTPSPDAIVAPSGGTHTSISSAYAAVSCGDLIYVRNGTYALGNQLSLSKTCSSGNEIIIRNYPGESPKVLCDNPANGSDVNRPEMNGQYNIWDGIEITNCWDGFKIHFSNNQVLNSKVHNNIFSGIVISPSAADITGIVIRGNTVEANGYVESETCTVGIATSCVEHINPADGATISIKNVQQIYFSNSTCNDIAGAQVDHNLIRNYGGRALQFNGLTGGSGNPCSSDGIRNIVFEDNTIINGSWGVALYYGNSGNTIRNNTFTLNGWLPTNDTEHYVFGIWGNADNEISGNTLNSTASTMRSYYFGDSSSDCNDGGLNDFNGNTWDLNTNDWHYNGTLRNDFSTAFNSVTGCGAADTLN